MRPRTSRQATDRPSLPSAARTHMQQRVGDGLLSLIEDQREVWITFANAFDASKPIMSVAHPGSLTKRRRRKRPDILRVRAPQDEMHCKLKRGGGTLLMQPDGHGNKHTCRHTHTGNQIEHKMTIVALRPRFFYNYEQQTLHNLGQESGVLYGWNSLKHDLKEGLGMHKYLHNLQNTTLWHA